MMKVETDIKKPVGLWIIIALLVANATITAIHYLPLLRGGSTVTEFALADLLLTITPSFFAAYGLWGIRFWGWTLTIIINGAYLHGMAVILGSDLLSKSFNAMSYVSVYFILYALLTTIYLWTKRNLFIRV